MPDGALAGLFSFCVFLPLRLIDLNKPKQFIYLLVQWVRDLILLLYKSCELIKKDFI
jgi:hypothetical protein